MGNHNRCWLTGRHAVMETLSAGRWPAIEVLLSEDLTPTEKEAVIALAGRQQTPVHLAAPRRLSQLCGGSDHQGFLARMRPFPYLTLDQLLTATSATPALCLLDRIQDPYNFGAILRSAEVLGLDGVLVGTAGQSEVTALVARSSAGAVNHVPLAQSNDLAWAAQRLQTERGLLLVAADHRADTPPSALDWRKPCALLIGNEATGVRPELRSLCDAAVRIPQVGQTESLNAGVAAGILFYEIRRQRDLL